MTDREWDRALGIQTMGREDERGGRAMPYEPTPYAVLVRLADSGLIGPGDRLVDYGCGKGRVAIFLAARAGCRAAGIDHSEKLVSMAEENRLRCPCPQQVRFERAQAERYDPKDAGAFFFFNPFSEAVLRAALLRILARRPGRPEYMRLFFYYPSEAYELCLAQEKRLRRAGEIDCRDLFGGSNPRERIMICETDG